MALLREGATRETIADTAGVPVHVVRRNRAPARYGWDFSAFKYRRDFTDLTPHTTVVGNTIEL